MKLKKLHLLPLRRRSLSKSKGTLPTLCCSRLFSFLSEMIRFLYFFAAAAVLLLLSLQVGTRKKAAEGERETAFARGGLQLLLFSLVLLFFFTRALPARALSPQDARAEPFEPHSTWPLILTLSSQTREKTQNKQNKPLTARQRRLFLVFFSYGQRQQQRRHWRKGARALAPCETEQAL